MSTFIIPIRYAESCDPDRIDIVELCVSQPYVTWDDVRKALDEALCEETCREDDCDFANCLDTVAAKFSGEWRYCATDVETYVIGG